jgi:hypothetical protein
MDFTQTALELEKHRAYLNDIPKEEVTHVIKSVIFHLEQKKSFQEEELKKINLTVLTNEPFNNLYFKYNKERLPLAGSIILQESDDLTFTISLCHHFKMRNALIIRVSNSQQSEILEIFLQTLNDNQLKSDFVKIIQ